MSTTNNLRRERARECFGDLIPVRQKVRIGVLKLGKKISHFLLWNARFTLPSFLISHDDAM